MILRFKPKVGIEKKLRGIEISAYDIKRSALDVLQIVSDEELKDTLSDVLDELIQAGRVKLKEEN